MDATAKALHDAALQIAPQGAQHDSSLCPFCQDSAREDQPVAPTVETETPVGTETSMDTIAKDAHEALLDKAVRDATDEASQKVAALESELESAKAELKTAQDELAAVKEESTRLNEELDAANLELKSAKDRVTELEADIAARDEQKVKDELAAARAKQVREMGLFDETYIEERASRWAEQSEEAWAERLEEWAALKAAPTATTDTASAMTGVKPSTNKKPQSARRAVLGLS